MAKIEEYCEVRTTSGIFRDWTTVAVSYTFGDYATPRKFRLQVAEPSLKTFLLKPEDRVDIALAGQLVIKEGYITDRQVAFDATRHGVQLDGSSKDGQITQVSVDVPGGQFRGYDIEALGNKVLQPYGLKFRLENPPDGAKEKFPNVAVRQGETPRDFLNRLAKQRGLWLRSDADGTIIAGSKQGGTPVDFQEGRNILSANSHIKWSAAEAVVSRSQQPGSDSLFGKKASEISARSKLGRGISGNVIKVLAEMPLSQKELQLRTNMAAQQLESSLVRVSVVCQGWLKPGSGGLWDLSEKVTVKSPMLFPTESGQMTLRVWGVTYTQDANGGTTTAIEMVNEAAFGQANPNAGASSPLYEPSASQAKPETST